MKYEKFIQINEMLKGMRYNLIETYKNLLSDIDFISKNYHHFFEDLLYLKHTNNINMYLEFRDSNGESFLDFNDDEFEFVWNNNELSSLFINEFEEEIDLEYLISTIIQESGHLSYQEISRFNKLKIITSSNNAFFEFCQNIHEDELNKVFNDLYNANETIQELKELLVVLGEIV